MAQGIEKIVEKTRRIPFHKNPITVTFKYMLEVSTFTFGAISPLAITHTPDPLTMLYAGACWERLGHYIGEKILGDPAKPPAFFHDVVFPITLYSALYFGNKT